jgi:hypothetical protein
MELVRRASRASGVLEILESLIEAARIDRDTATAELE